MANLKEIRNRISSVSSTMQITSAMKMVSAAKLKRATDAIVALRPYAEKLQEILSNVSSSLDSSEGVYSAERDVKNILVIAVSSNRGLCGGFNNAIMKEVNKITEGHQDSNVKIFSLGKKTYEAYLKTPYHTTEGQKDIPYVIYDDLTYENTSEIANVVMEQFVEGTWDKVLVVYNRFKNAAVQIPTVEQFLPVMPPEVINKEAAVAATIQYEFEPSKEYIVNNIVPNSLKTQLFKALLDSQASEHGARMTAMHKATENATEMRDDLKLHYNKARQAAITNEILEIVGGAEALNA